MDYDVSNANKGSGASSSSCGVMHTVDAAAIFLDTLKAFAEADRLEHLAANDDFAAGDGESFLPSLENILAFSSYIRENIVFLLNNAGLDYEPPFEIDMDARSGGIVLRGDRNDLNMISRLINLDEETRDGLVTLLSIAEQTYHLLENIDSDTPLADITRDEKVVYLFGDGYLSLYKEHNE